jgi:hypothetical protein
MHKGQAADPTVEDLTWYYCHSAAELGVKSNLGAALARLELGIDGGKSVQTDGGMIGRLQSAARYREIHNKLMSIPAKHRKTLELAFEERQIPVSLRLTFDRSAGIAASMPLARRAYKAAMVRSNSSSLTLPEWLARSVVLGTKDDRAIVEIIRERAERLLNDAYAAYRAARS